MSEGKALACIPRTMPEIQSMAEVLAKSNLLPDALRNKVPDVVVQIMAGAELGMPPMAAIRGVHIVQGKPLLSADTMVALVRASGSCEYFMVESETDALVTYVCKRLGDPKEQRYTWSDDDTKAAGLNTKDNWRLYKKQMRRARCKAILARDVWPDVLSGIYESDSGEIDVPRSVSVPRPVADPLVNEEIIDAEIVEPAPPNEWIAKMDAATTVDELKALGPEIAKQVTVPDAKKLTNDHYRSRMEALKSA